MCVAYVVDVDRVASIIAESEKVGCPGRILERDVVGDQCDRAGLVGTDECVDVGIVDRWVGTDRGGFPVAGCERRRREKNPDTTIANALESALVDFIPFSVF